MSCHLLDGLVGEVLRVEAVRRPELHRHLELLRVHIHLFWKTKREGDEHARTQTDERKETGPSARTNECTHREDAAGLAGLGRLDHRQPHRPQAEDGHRRPLLNVARLEHGAQPRGDPAAEEAHLSDVDYTGGLVVGIITRGRSSRHPARGRLLPARVLALLTLSSGALSLTLAQEISATTVYSANVLWG